MNKIKIAIIGCGRVSKYHIEALNNLKKKYDLVSVCDDDQLKLDEVN